MNPAVLRLHVCGGDGRLAVTLAVDCVVAAEPQRDPAVHLVGVRVAPRAVDDPGVEREKIPGLDLSPDGYPSQRRWRETRTHPTKTHSMKRKKKNPLTFETFDV